MSEKQFTTESIETEIRDTLETLEKQMNFLEQEIDDVTIRQYRDLKEVKLRMFATANRLNDILSSGIYNSQDIATTARGSE